MLFNVGSDVGFGEPLISPFNTTYIPSHSVVSAVGSIADFVVSNKTADTSSISLIDSIPFGVGVDVGSVVVVVMLMNHYVIH